ncbi:2-phosphosulfolactate phosphatase [Aneurinibacillus sp. Ricciae_BoGa-3]|uniref:2-phosphosulfolactate phosphatase n=1 Tax=Aneurinibacillus sp. Ricciae_BoGa-3 TaxID=3022697 RepID=UPI002341CD92|nr:2-phosphosulfolactate phosphatase [Aneurinibacillus sp. Ricciae_BoGa-3]WCK53549.1 2-phosphosulfolactate phosphatase [Aneurinibacillus sp. Ricciae_BoGa-3]
MRIEVVPTVEEIRHEQLHNRTAIVIDVLRASSTIVTALSTGFASVIPVETVGQAYALRAKDIVLAGERHCKSLNEFDYNNSPTAIAAASSPEGKQLVLTTTNGTRAIQKAARASCVLIGCFLNATACIQEALRRKHDIVLYCAGTRQEFALEDGLAAGCMVHKARELNTEVQVCDLGSALEAGYLNLAPEFPDCLFHTITGRRLVQHHHTPDILYCSQLDLEKIVPIVKEKRILPCNLS